MLDYIVKLSTRELRSDDKWTKVAKLDVSSIMGSPALLRFRGPECSYW